MTFNPANKYSHGSETKERPDADTQHSDSEQLLHGSNKDCVTLHTRFLIFYAIFFDSEIKIVALFQKILKCIHRK